MAMIPLAYVVYLISAHTPTAPLLPPPLHGCVLPSSKTSLTSYPAQLRIYAPPTDPEFGYLITLWNRELDVYMGWDLHVYNRTLSESMIPRLKLPPISQTRLQLLQAQLAGVPVPQTLGHDVEVDLSETELTWNYFFSKRQIRTVAHVEVIKIKHAMDGTLTSPATNANCTTGWCAITPWSLLWAAGSPSSERACRVIDKTRTWGIAQETEFGKVEFHSSASGIYVSYDKKNVLNCQNPHTLYHSEQGPAVSIEAVLSSEFTTNSKSHDRKKRGVDQDLADIQEGEELDWIYGQEKLLSMETEGTLRDIVNRTMQDLQHEWMRDCLRSRSDLKLAIAISEMFPAPLINQIVGHDGFVVKRVGKIWRYGVGIRKIMGASETTLMGWTSSGPLIRNDVENCLFVLKCGSSAAEIVLGDLESSVENPVIPSCLITLINGSYYDLVSSTLIPDLLPEFHLKINSGNFKHSTGWKTEHSSTLLQSLEGNGAVIPRQRLADLSGDSLYGFRISNTDSMLNEAILGMKLALHPTIITYFTSFLLFILILIFCLLCCCRR